MQFRLKTIFLITAVIACVLYLYISIEPALDSPRDSYSDGWKQAERDLENGTAVRHGDYARFSRTFAGQEIDFTFMHDTWTGLRCSFISPYEEARSYARGYNAAVDEFIKTNGFPSCSKRDRFVDINFLAECLMDEKAPVLRSLPARIGSCVEIQKAGKDRGIVICTPFMQHGVGYDRQYVSVFRSPAHEDVIIIVINNQWLGVFLDSGEHIQSASGFNPLRNSNRPRRFTVNRWYSEP